MHQKSVQRLVRNCQASSIQENSVPATQFLHVLYHRIYNMRLIILLMINGTRPLVSIVESRRFLMKTANLHLDYLAESD